MVRRQPIVRPDRDVRGYAVRVVVRVPLSAAHRVDELDAIAQENYELLDLPTLAGGCTVFLRATTAMLTGPGHLPAAEGSLVLEVPRQFSDRPDAVAHLSRLRASGVRLALAEYEPGGPQDAQLPLVEFAKVDLARGEDACTLAFAQVHRAGALVIAERVDSEAAVRFCASNGVELLQGPLFRRDTEPIARKFSAGELQCLELMALLSSDDVDPGQVIPLVRADPALAIRVLRLVNSTAFGLRVEVDSIDQAVTLLGPRELGALASAALIGAGSNTVGALWFVLTRALACRALAGDDAGYTIGLLSAVASQLRVSPLDLIARSGVSDDVGDALLGRSGPYGPVLAAVLAHEESDTEGIEAAGLRPSDVARVYLAAVADALATATSLS